jgi:hypothetical protein
MKQTENPLPDYRHTAGINRTKYTHANNNTYFYTCFRLLLLQLITQTNEETQISYRSFDNNDENHKYGQRLCA